MYTEQSIITLKTTCMANIFILYKLPFIIKNRFTLKKGHQDNQNKDRFGLKGQKKIFRQNCWSKYNKKHRLNSK